MSHVSISYTVKGKGKYFIPQFREYMSGSSLSLIHSDKNSLSYKKEIPVQNPNCTTAGCLLLFGILPGIIYYLVARKDASTSIVNFNVNGDTFTISGNHMITKIARAFENRIESQ